MARLIVVSFGLEQEYVEQIKTVAAEYGFDVLYSTDTATVTEILPEMEVLFSYTNYEDMFRRARRLRWIQSVSAGVNQWMVPGLLESDIVITNSSGIHGVPISELILSQMLCFATGMYKMIKAQTTKDTGMRQAVIDTKFELEGQTLGIIGLGSIGDTLAYKAKALGMHVLGLKRNPVEKPTYVDLLYGPEQLPELLRQSDHVALCLPLTDETNNYIGATELALMKPSAFIYNIGRGASIDQAALIDALKAGSIGGAGLDVTTPDPPDKASELWDLPNVMLSMHTSGHTPKGNMRVTDLFLKNLHRYATGEKLLNIVDKNLKY